MKIMISGPCTGMPDHNYPAFYQAASQLLMAGHEPLNPARPEGREHCSSWLDYMRASLKDLAEADAVAQLPGWRDSRGARIEHAIADLLGIPVEPISMWVWTGDD